MKRLSFKTLLGTLVLLSIAAGAIAAGAFKPGANMARTDIPTAYKWDLSALFKDTAEWQKLYDDTAKQLGGLDLCKGKLGTDARQTLDCLETYVGFRKTLDRLESFGFQWWSVEMKDSNAQTLKEKASDLRAKLDEHASFIDPEMQKVPANTWEALVKKEPKLGAYNHYFKDLKRRQEHLLDSEREAMLAGTGPMREGPYTVMNALAQSVPFPSIKDEEGKEVPLSFSVFSRYRSSKSRDVRKAAVETFFGTLGNYQDVWAASLATSVKGAVFEAKARGYNSSLEMMTDVDAVPVSVYNNLLETTGQWLPKTLHRYVGLRKKLLGLQEIHYYDLYSPLFDGEGALYTYDQGTKLVEESLKAMGPDYLAILTQGMAPGSGWVDVFPGDGKKSGAYCNAAYGYHPFVLLNHMEDLDDVFTLTHEMGHAMHFYMAHQAQPYVTSDSPIFLAEVASTFQEEMLLSDLLKKAKTKEEKLILLNKRVENIRLTITRQTMFAEFEKLIHAEVEAGGALTAARLNELYLGLVKKYFGPEFTVDPTDQLEWAYIPHFYYNFYVYKYSTGLMAAIVFSQRIQAGNPGAIQGYKAFLASGGSDYPMAILSKSGIDFSSPEIVADTYKLFAKTLDEMEALLAQ